LKNKSTVKNSKFERGSNSATKSVVSITHSSKNSNSRNGDLKSLGNKNSKTRAITTRLYKKPIEMEFSPDILHLKGEKVKQLKISEKYKRNLASRDGGLKSTLMSDKVSRKTSTDDVKETMTAVYDTGKFLIYFDLETNVKSRALSPISHVSSFKNLQRVKWENLNKAMSPTRFGNKPGTKYLKNRNR